MRLQKVREATEGRGADLTIETTGVMKQLADSIHMTRSGGKVLLFGIYTAKEGALPFYDIYFKEISLISARVAKPEDYTACIDARGARTGAARAARQRRDAARRAEGGHRTLEFRQRTTDEDHPGAFVIGDL